MAQSLFSSSWYRVATLRPRLRSQARIVRHAYRGERWYILQDMASGRFLRLDATAYRMVALMDGLRSVEEIWLAVGAALGDAAPTQDETIGLMSQLHQANVLQTDRQPDLDELSERRAQTRSQKLKQYIGNPLSLKLPLLDPDAFLGWLADAFAFVRLRWLIVAWLALVGGGLLLAGMHWAELTSDITARVFTPENMFLLWLAFPLLKGIHELGHGLVIKAFGGSCRELGLMFLIFVPVPYVDATAATAFPDKRQRMAVGLAGMMTELAVAALAVVLWSWSAEGVGRAFLHQVIILASVTTVLFNINPLLRFDGYYVLADYLEIPNLGQKANRYVGYLTLRHLFRVGENLSPPHLTPGEAPWLAAYAVGSFVYRMMVSVVIVISVAQHYFFIGVLMALWAIWNMLLSPLVRNLRFLAADGVLHGRRRQAIALTSVGAGLLAAFVLWVPAPSWTMAEGVIWMSEEARLRAPHPCFGRAVLHAPGTPVKAGEALLSCTDPELETELTQIASRMQELEARLLLAVNADRVQIGIVRAEIEYYANRQRDLEARRAAMVIAAAHDGVFAMEAPADFPGHYAARGDVLGYVLEPRAFTLLSVVPQGEVDLVRTRTERVELRSADRLDELLQASIAREVPAATKDLPSMALALQGGGQIGLDPEGSQGQQGPQALTALFQFEMKFTGDIMPQTLGNRVFVRFVHRAEPLADQWYRSVRQLFLKRFAV